MYNPNRPFASQPDNDPFPSLEYFANFAAGNSPQPPFNFDIGPKTSARSRILSWLIDFTVFVLILTLIELPVILFYKPANFDFRIYRGFISLNSETLSLLARNFALVFAFLVIGIYLVVSISRGQTLGNRLTHIKFVTRQGEKPGYDKALQCVLIELASCFAASYIFQMLTNCIILIFTGVPAIYLWLISFFIMPMVWVLIANCWMFFNPNKQTLFDKINDLYVVEAE